MFRTVARIAAALSVTVALSLSTAPAFAADGPSKSDRKAAAAANRICAPLTDEVTWEACARGAVIRMTGRGLDVDDYHVSPKATLVLDHKTRALHKSSRKVSAGDKRALIDTNAACAYMLKGKRKSTNRWINCQVGMFSMITGRAVTDADIKVKGTGSKRTLSLTHRSHKMSGVSPY